MMDALHSGFSDELRKLGGEEPARGKYLPWYGAAGLGTVGHQLATRAVPGKLKAPAQVIGTLIGTGVGVHGGEAAARRLSKTAAEKKPTVPGTLARSLGGFGVGTAAGYGAGKAMEAIAKRQGFPTHKLVPAVATAAGAAIGAGYPIWKAYEQRELQRAVQRS